MKKLVFALLVLASCSEEIQDIYPSTESFLVVSASRTTDVTFQYEGGSKTVIAYRNSNLKIEVPAGQIRYTACNGTQTFTHSGVTRLDIQCD